MRISNRTCAAFAAAVATLGHSSLSIFVLRYGRRADDPTGANLEHRGVAFAEALGCGRDRTEQEEQKLKNAIEYFLAKPDPTVTSVVAIGVTSRAIKERNTLDELAKVRIPILDIYGDTDEETGIIETAPQRAAQAKKAPNPDYRQIQIKGSNHFHSGKEEELTKTIVNWLEQQQ